MKLNAKKSLSLGAVNLYVGEVELTEVPKCKILGHMLHRDARLAETQSNRVKEVQRRLQRVALVPGTKQQRISMIAATVTLVLYGFETAQFAHETLRELRYDVWQAVRAFAYDLCSGHRIDPVQYLAYRTVKSWIRWLRQPHLDQDCNVLGIVCTVLHTQLAHLVRDR